MDAFRRLNAYQTLVNLNPSRGQIRLDQDFYGGSDTVTITLDGTDRGRTFEGIGAVSAGASS